MSLSFDNVIAHVAASSELEWDMARGEQHMRSGVHHKVEEAKEDTWKRRAWPKVWV